MPESVPVNTTVVATNAEVALAQTGPVPGSQGPTNVDQPVVPVIPQVIVKFSYYFTWGATTTTLTLRCRRGVGTGGQEVTTPGGLRPVQQGPGTATPGVVTVEWVDTNVPVNTVYTITGQTGTAAVTAASGYVSTNDCT